VANVGKKTQKPRPTSPLMANQFNCEVFDCGLLNNQSRISVTTKTCKTKSGYRIFRAGDQTPTSEDESEMATSIRDIDLEHVQDHDHRKGIFSFHESSSDYESEEEKPHKKSLKELLHLTLPRKKSEKTDRKNSTPRVSVVKESVAKSRDSVVSTGRDSVKESPATTPKERTSLFRKNSFKDTSAYFKDLLTTGRRTSIGSNNSDSLDIPTTRTLSRSSSDISLEEKYGDTSSVLGRGSYATVKLCCPHNSKEKFAVKEFRQKKKNETQKEYIKKLQAEFCIASSMDNENIVKSVDLIQDSHHQWCVVMEYCQGGDLFSRISNGSLTSEGEKNCYFVQLIHGAQYLHSIGVAHRDLKPGILL
jgi:hypothetical protein